MGRHAPTRRRGGRASEPTDRTDRGGILTAPAPLFFHQDDYGKVEILPASNAAWCRAQLAESGTFADGHRAPEGLAWTDAGVPGEAAERLGALGIVESAVDACIPDGLPRYDHVVTGSSTEREICERTRGYRTGAHGALYVAWTDEAIVRSIWLVDGVDDARRRYLIEALVGLGELADLLLVDWRGALVDLSDRRRVERYVTSG